MDYLIELLGMRDATQHEIDCVNNYIRSISTRTGVSFWDFFTDFFTDK